MLNLSFDMLVAVFSVLAVAGPFLLVAWFSRPPRKRSGPR